MDVNGGHRTRRAVVLSLNFNPLIDWHLLMKEVAFSLGKLLSCLAVSAELPLGCEETLHTHRAALQEQYSIRNRSSALPRRAAYSVDSGGADTDFRS